MRNFQKSKADHRIPPKGDNWLIDWKTAGVLLTSAAQRRAVAARDGGKCAGCGQIVKKWQADHIIALHTIPPSHLEEYPACLRFWAVGNLQTLGVTCGCHPKKTAQEAGSRAKVKRIIKKAAGIRKPTPFQPCTKKWQKKAKPKFTSRHRVIVSYIGRA